MRGVYYLCAVKPRQTRPLLYKLAPSCTNVVDKDTIKSEILPHLSVAKRGYVSESASGGSYSIRSLQVESLAANGRLLLRLYDAVFVGCEQQALQPLALVVVSARAFRAVNYERVCGIIVFFV